MPLDKVALYFFKFYIIPAIIVFTIVVGTFGFFLGYSLG